MSAAGPLSHMTVNQLIDYMSCKGLPLPTVGTGVNGRITKADYLRAITGSFVMPYGGPNTHITARTGMLRDMQLKPPAQRTHYGGQEENEEDLWKSVKQHNDGIEFVRREQVGVPHLSRLWSTVVGHANNMTVWRGNVDDMLVVQYLSSSGIEDETTAADLWMLAMRESMRTLSSVPKWSSSLSRIMYDPTTIGVKDFWTVRVGQEDYYGLCLFKGNWNVSLESLFSEGIPEDKRFSFELLSSLDDAVQHVLKHTSSLAGRDTQHYAWRFETLSSSFKISGGEGGERPWLILSLMPFPYFFRDYSSSSTPPPSDMTVDKFVRSAAVGTGSFIFSSSSSGNKEEGVEEEEESVVYE
jgi:hypothetical protein